MTPAPAVPPEWPAGVPPPESPEFTAAAVRWLFDVAPPDLRGHDVLRRHPVLLAAVAWHAAEGARDGLRAALAGLRVELAQVVAPEVVAAGLAAVEQEVARAEATARSVRAVSDALRGRRWVPRL